jgi:hypothetical protein
MNANFLLKVLLVLSLFLNRLQKTMTLRSCPISEIDVGGVKKMLSNHPSTSIVSHHKSGTVAAEMLVSNMCCPQSLNISKHWEFWEIFKSTCKDSCRILELVVDGAPSWLECLLWSGDKKSPFESVVVEQSPHKVIHFIRHPVDMLVSGYLYHKRCSETWTSRSKLDPARIPPDLFDTIKGNFNSYCQYLKNVDVNTGMEIELRRSLFAKDGIGRMLLDHILFQMASFSRLIEVNSICLDQLNDLSWRELAGTLGIKKWTSFKDTVREDHATTETSGMLVKDENDKILRHVPNTLTLDAMVGLSVKLLEKCGLLYSQNQSSQMTSGDGNNTRSAHVNLTWVLAQYNMTSQWAVKKNFPCKSSKLN